MVIFRLYRSAIKKSRSIIFMVMTIFLYCMRLNKKKLINAMIIHIYTYKMREKNGN